jgi:CRP-like cAMP-binding protein
MADEYSVPALLNQLRVVDLLRELDDDVLGVLAQRVVVSDFAPGEVVVAEGDDAAGLHLILRGTALVERGGMPIALVGPGEHIGEIALLDGQPRVATVRAQDDLRTGFLTSSDFLDVLEDNPSVALELLLAMAARFRLLEERLSEVEARLAEKADD